MGWLLPMLLGVAMAAGLQGFYLESPASPARAEAARVARVASAEGMRARVVRRYSHGSGWQYFARIEGLTGQEEADRLAQDLAGQAGVPVRVFRVEGQVARSLRETRHVKTQPQPPPQQEADAPQPASGETSARWLQAARAHGGARGGIAAVQGAPQVLFRYRRSLSGGGEVLHTWARKGEAIYLEVDVAKGTGVDSRLLVLPDGAWLARGPEAPVSKEREAALRQVERFGPRAVMGLALALGSVSPSSVSAGEVIEITGIGSCDSLILSLAGGAKHRLCLDSETHHLVASQAMTDDAVRRWSGYRELDLGVVVPEVCETLEDGAVVDHVEILSLELAPELPLEWFDSSSM